MKKHLLLLLAFTFASNYQFSSKTGINTNLDFTNNQININEENGFSKISSGGNSTTTEEGMPELPMYTSFFQMDPDKEYTASYNVISSHIVENINIYPFQGHDEESFSSDEQVLKISKSIYDSDSTYPEENISLSEPMVMRDIEVGLISFVPFKYNFSNKSLEVFDEVEITISENGNRASASNIPEKRSLLFEPFYNR